MNSTQKGSQKDQTLSFIVEDKTYVSKQQFLLGHQIKALIGLSPDVKLFLQNREPWIDNLIENDEEVDLARPGVEYFFIEKAFDLKINEKAFVWRQRFITGKQVRELAVIGEESELLLKTVNGNIDQLVKDDEKVDLLQPGIEWFYSKEEEKEIILIVGGVPKKWDKKTITFKEVIILAYGSYNDRPTMVYTVAYEDGPRQNREGSMVKGSDVFTKDKMIFHATATDKS